MDINKLNEELKRLLNNSVKKHVTEARKNFTTKDAVELAFSDKSEDVKEIIINWYENENAIDDFDSVEDYADFMIDDIDNMIWAADVYTSDVLKLRKAFGFDDDIDESLNEKVETVKAWYTKTYPTDELGQEIPSDLTFDKIYNNISKVYELLEPADDSIIRERIFQKLAELKGVDYDTIYSAWLNESLNEEERPVKTIKYVTVDDWNRPIFKLETNGKKYYLSDTENLFDYGTSEKEIKKFYSNLEPLRDYITYHGKSIDSEPMGSKLKFDLVLI